MILDSYVGTSSVIRIITSHVFNCRIRPITKTHTLLHSICSLPLVHTLPSILFKVTISVFSKDCHSLLSLKTRCLLHLFTYLATRDWIHSLIRQTPKYNTCTYRFLHMHLFRAHASLLFPMLHPWRGVRPWNAPTSSVQFYECTLISRTHDRSLSQWKIYVCVLTWLWLSESSCLSRHAYLWIRSAGVLDLGFATFSVSSMDHRIAKWYLAANPLSMSRALLWILGHVWRWLAPMTVC